VLHCGGLANLRRDQGRPADIRTPDMTNEEFSAWLKRIYSDEIAAARLLVYPDETMKESGLSADQAAFVREILNVVPIEILQKAMKALESIGPASPSGRGDDQKSSRVN